MSSPLHKNIAECAARVSALSFPTLSRRATPAELEAAAEFLRELWRAVDPLIEAVGIEVSCRAYIRSDLDCFQRQLEGALDGNATFVLERAAEREREMSREYAA